MDKERIATRKYSHVAHGSAGDCLRDCRAWEPPDSAPALGAGQVHLWVVDRERLSVGVLTQAIPVSQEESERAGDYRFPRDRVRYLAGRMVLRDLLARYLEVRPAEVSLNHGTEGKPRLAPPNPESIQFSVTHADRFTLIAIARRAAVGVDLEAVDPQPGQIKLARYILTEREQAEFEVLPERTKLDRFYLMWTMKEAVLKAFGTGFRDDPQKLEIGVGLAPVEVCRIAFKGEDRGPWTLIQLPATEGYKAALVVEGAGRSLACWRWVAPLQR